ncbi:hypothetical protein EZH22_16185 [Xanthobacter dioxanivorans]|uniref:Lipoprotein n=1 Tax=Xanthobacter dioxanivorans TaxID=2528964 RepID=A0A974SHT2_9HYPH|nr:hypothetical protein [Xanthobacter dioxanivorans]QRG04703.1 hypothetical protein EZH22_16185 [Xanthobacter dioxanivorans]
MIRAIRVHAPVAALCGALVGCATPEQVEDAQAKRAASWGGRTLIGAYRFSGPIAAYFEPPPPGAKGGRLLVWEEGRREVIQGEWTVRNFKLCVKPNVYYKEMMGGPFDREACLGFDSSAVEFDHFQGDAFALKTKRDVPYVSSKADNDKFAAVMRTTPYYAPANGGFSEGLYPAREGAPATPAEPVADAAAQ